MHCRRLSNLGTSWWPDKYLYCMSLLKILAGIEKCHISEQPIRHKALKRKFDISANVHKVLGWRHQHTHIRLWYVPNLEWVATEQGRACCPALNKGRIDRDTKNEQDQLSIKTTNFTSLVKDAVTADLPLSQTSTRKLRLHSPPMATYLL